jgi:hypothetical protein
MTGHTVHRQEEFVLMWAKSKGSASNRRSHFWLLREQRDHWHARMPCRREPRLALTQDARWAGYVGNVG